MMSNPTRFLLVTLFLAICIHPAAEASEVRTLHTGWEINSSGRIDAGGKDISSLSYSTAGWHEAVVPSTVLGTLVTDGMFPDIFSGRNLEKVPDSLFAAPWWYRTTFSLPARTPGADHVILRFLGINYRADIWLNGRQIAGSDSIVGGFRQFSFDVSKLVNFGGMNALAVKVYRPGPGAVTLGFVDWNPKPADHDMGLWRPVELNISGDVSITRPFVATRVDTATLKEAELSVSAELANHGTSLIAGVLRGNIGPVHFSRTVTIAPGESKEVLFSPDTYRQLVFKDPRLWWTHDLGKPNLYSLHLEFDSQGHILDSAHVQFGIRQINDYIDAQGFRGFKLNGRKILIRGGGWADQMFLDQNFSKIKAEVNYAVNMHLNALRLEGFWGENSDLYRLCDEKGLLIMVGWSAQWEWKPFFGDSVDQHGGIMTPEQMNIAARSFRDQVIWLRNHPSIFVWMYGSDRTPRPALERKYLAILARYDTTRPHLASAQEHVSPITGPTAVKMRGPYDYVPPDYWYADTSYGGAFGFNTETGPGPQVPRISSLKRMLSPDSLWPINSQWDFHCSHGIFGNLDRYNAAIDGRLGKPIDLSDYERKAQFTNYEAMRAMMEAFGAMKFKSTGVIQWMYNTAWPKMWWQLFDYYLNPTGAFYGAQEACMPLHAAYDYSSHKIYFINSTLKPADGLRLVARVLDLNLKERFRSEMDVNSQANSSFAAMAIPHIDSLSETYFLDLKVYRKDSLIDDNFYALSTKPDMLDWKKSSWYVTPDTSYADLKGLETLRDANVSVECRFIGNGGDDSVIVRLHNPTDRLAFMVYLSVRNGKEGLPALPVYWDANYITLLPGESRTISGTFPVTALNGNRPVLRVSGWNVKPQSTGR